MPMTRRVVYSLREQPRLLKLRYVEMGELP
jgi:hypothetical protein